MPDEKTTPGRYPTPRSMEAPQHPTQQIEKVPAWAIALTEKVDGIATTTRTTANEVSDLHQWKGEVNEWREEVNEKLRSNSLQAKQPSEHDLASQAAIAIEAARRVDLEKKVDRIEQKTDEQTALLKANNNDTSSILRALGIEAKGFFARNPKVRDALIYVVISALTAAGGWIAAKGGHP